MKLPDSTKYCKLKTKSFGGCISTLWCSTATIHKRAFYTHYCLCAVGRRSFIEVNKAVPRCFLSSLEDCLAAQGCAGVEILRQDLEKTTTKLHCAQACEVHLKAELACLKERWMLASLCAHIIIWMYKFDHWCVLNLWHQRALWCFYDLLRLERVSRQRADQSKTEELRGFKAEYDSSVAEMKKVRNSDWLYWGTLLFCCFWCTYTVFV